MAARVERCCRSGLRSGVGAATPVPVGSELWRCGCFGAGGAAGAGGALGASSVSPL